MFYCDPCAQKNNWPESFSRSFGKCEVCGERAPCYDTPSRLLPKADAEPQVSFERLAYGGTPNVRPEDM